jgi:lipase (class 3)
VPDKAQSLLLCDLIAPGYVPGFLAYPAKMAEIALTSLGFELVDIVYGIDFKGLFGQERVPYGIIAKASATGQIYCAFRGTDSLKEWLEDGWAIPEPWPFAGHTHKGFTDVYQTLTVGMVHIVDYLADKNAIVTGHSLGAALATLVAAALGKLCPLCVTFEGPRVGDLGFIEWMDERVPSFFRYVIIGDVVPHAPPENMGYQHAGTEIDMDPAGIIPLTLDPEEYLLTHHQLTYVRELIAA